MVELVTVGHFFIACFVYVVICLLVRLFVCQYGRMALAKYCDHESIIHAGVEYKFLV